MDLRGKWPVRIGRILLGLILLFFGIFGLYAIITGNIPAMETTPAIDAANAGLAALGLMYVAKIIEIVTGLMLLFNFRPAFAAVLLAPITVGIVIYNALLYPFAAGILAYLTALLNLYLGYAYWDKYKAMFEK